MRKKLRLIFLLCIFAGGLVMGPKWWGSVRESLLHSKIKRELIDRLPEFANEPWRIYLDGPEGIIHGTVSSQALYGEVCGLVAELAGGGKGSIRGLEKLECALTIPHQSALTLSIDDESGAIHISGEIPASAEATLAGALEGAYPEGSIERDIQLSSGAVLGAPWAGPLGEIIPTLARSVGNLSIELEGRAITINGRVASEATRVEVQDLLLERLAGSIDFVRNGLTTLEGDLETSFLTVEVSDADTVVLHGRVHSLAARDQLIRGVEAIAPAGFLVESRLRVRPAAGGSWWIRPALAFLPEVFDSLQGGELHVDATGLKLSAAFAEEQELRNLESLAKNYFPPNIYAMASEIAQPINAVPETAVATSERPPDPPITTVAAAEDVEDEKPTPPPAPDQPDQVNRPEAEVEKLIASTQIFFSSGSTRVRETEREKLTILAEKLTSVPELKIDISGLADPVGNAAANRRLAKRRCTSVLIALEESGIDPSRLQVIGGGERSPDPGEPSWKLRRVEFAIHTPKPEPQILGEGASSDWRDSIAATHIYFRTNSTQLTLAERSKLDRVAALLRQDTPGVLGISGFTDRFGNRSYNQRLSELRCKSVHDYLVGQGVPAGRLKTQPGGILADAAAGEPSWMKRRVQFHWIRAGGEIASLRRAQRKIDAPVLRAHDIAMRAAIFAVPPPSPRAPRRPRPRHARPACAKKIHLRPRGGSRAPPAHHASRREGHARTHRALRRERPDLRAHPHREKIRQRPASPPETQGGRAATARRAPDHLTLPRPDRRRAPIPHPPPGLGGGGDRREAHGDRARTHRQPAAGRTILPESLGSARRGRHPRRAARDRTLPTD